MSDRLDSKAVGNWQVAYQIASQKGAKRLPFLREYLTEIYYLAPMVNLSPDWLVAQSSHETGFYTSTAWDKFGNPAGIGITDGMNYGYVFKDGRDAARAQIIHMWGYVYGPALPVTLDNYRDVDPRWNALRASGWMGSVKTVGDLVGKWATDRNYAIGLARHYAALIQDRVPTYEEELPSMPTTPSTTGKLIILSAGHRNTNKGGAKGEYEWTMGATRILAEQLRKRGARVLIVQEQDGDGDPSFTNRPLGAIGQIAASLSAKHGPAVAFISMHYNGGPARGFHIIPPDANGLRHGGTGRVVTGDSKADNPLDWKVARLIRDRLLASKSVPQISWPAEKGVMSEKETNVGSQGWRLAELQEARPMQDDAVRLIIEAGSIDTADRAFIGDKVWVRNVYSEAIIDGLEEALGKLGNGASIPDSPTETPIPPIPGGDAPQDIDPLDAAEQVNDNTDTMVAYMPAEGYTWVWINDWVEALKDTPPYADVVLSSKRTRADGKMIVAKERFVVRWLGIPLDAKKPKLYRTLWKTIVLADDTVRVQDAVEETA